MSTINGCGTKHYDWLHLPDGTAHATEWIVLCFFPIVPLKRVHLRVAEARTLRATFYILGRVPMDARGIARTYMKAYLLLPLVLLAAPVVLFFIYSLALRFLHWDPHSRWIPVAITVPCLIYWGVVLSLILERSFGRKPISKDSRI
jgi:hypothetical protein